METAVATIRLRSTAFEHNEYIPSHYTCEGANVNPPILIRDIPENTTSLALVVDDPDAPSGTFTHWLVWNITPNIEVIAEGMIPGMEGINSAGKHSYYGPCPPRGTHRYFFKAYALNTVLNLNSGDGIFAFEQAIQNHIMAYGEMIGLYEKKNISR